MKSLPFLLSVRVKDDENSHRMVNSAREVDVKGYTAHKFSCGSITDSSYLSQQTSYSIILCFMLLPLRYKIFSAKSSKLSLRTMSRGSNKAESKTKGKKQIVPSIKTIKISGSII